LAQRIPQIAYGCRWNEVQEQQWNSVSKLSALR